MAVAEDGVLADSVSIVTVAVAEDGVMHGDSDGAKALDGIAAAFSGCIPVVRKPPFMFEGVNAIFQASLNNLGQTHIVTVFLCFTSVFRAYFVKVCLQWNKNTFIQWLEPVATVGWKCENDNILFNGIH